jgi:hypothetical protein
LVRSSELFAAPWGNGPFNVVIVDLPTPDLDRLRQAKRAYSDANVIALCGSYREADWIAKRQRSRRRAGIRLGEGT